MIRNVVVTVDYEIFGNGTGDVMRHIIEPANRMANICEKYKVPLTVFAEIEEYLEFKRFAKKLRTVLNCDPTQLIREQLEQFTRNGHDVQLHLHPEWYGAEAEIEGLESVEQEGGKKPGEDSQISYKIDRLNRINWKLNTSKHTVDSLFSTEKETTQYIRERKEVIEDITGKPVVAYRAGAFSAQPGEKLINALAENKIKIDTSVVKGLVRRDEHVEIDYRRVPSFKGPWRIEKDVANESAQGRVWEFPIYSVMRRRIHQLTLSRLRAKFSRNVPKERQREMVQQLGIKKNPVSWIKFLWQPVPIKMDYHNVSPEKLYRWIKEAPLPKEGSPDVVVLIGHTKEHVDDGPLDRFLKRVIDDPQLRVSSLSDIAQMIGTGTSPTQNMPPEPEHRR